MAKERRAGDGDDWLNDCASVGAKTRALLGSSGGLMVSTSAYSGGYNERVLRDLKTNG